MTRWLFIFLAVVLGCFQPTNAHALTRASQAAYDTRPPVEIIVFVAGITMDTDQGSSQDPLSLHKYLYCEANPVNNIDPTGFTIWLCTRRTTDDFPTYGFGRHCYLWDDRANAPMPRSCGMETVWWWFPSTTSGPTDIGPIAGSNNPLSSNAEAFPVGNSEGHEDEIMTYGRQHINDGWIFWSGSAEDGSGGHDCHAAAIRVLSHFPYLKIPPHRRYDWYDHPIMSFMEDAVGKSILDIFSYSDSTSGWEGVEF